MSRRTGKYVRQPGGYRAFVPNPLPPKESIEHDSELLNLLSEADRALARLDGIVTVLPNPDLFIAMYVKKEALLSSQIEGTQASLEGVLEFEADLKPKDDINEVKEVVNYIKALNYGIEQLLNTPFSLELIKGIHKILIGGTRGTRRNIGEFRTTQNWIGPRGASVFDATFVPPPPSIIPKTMGNLLEFLNSEDSIPPLVKIALIHAQFESIHPFLDGNGRLGRLLITFYLIRKGILSKPLLYLSFYLKKNRAEYYELLMKVRNESVWNQWVKFFLLGILEISKESSKTAREIIDLKDKLINRLYEHSVSSIYGVKLVDLLFKSPLIDLQGVVEQLKVHKDTINELFKRFEELGILKEITGKQRYRKYLFKEYVDIIAKGTRE